MYHSPFRLIDPEAFSSGLDADALRRRLGLEKRKLMAEFELAGTATITINGHDLQRQDVKALFDELQDPVRLRMHVLIRGHAAFLQFLETAMPGTDGSWLYPASLEDGDPLLRYVSPFYAEALNKYLQHCLQGMEDPRALLYELRTDDWILPAHYEAAYRYPLRFFTEKKNELIRIRYESEQRRSVIPEQIRSWCDDQQIHVLNRLPDGFDQLRYDLAERLNNLCVLYDRQNAKKLALAAIERAATIRVHDEELERLVPANLRIIRNKNGTRLMQVDPDTGRRRIKVLPLIGLLLLLVRLLAVGGGCFNSDSNPPLLRNPVSFEAVERTEQEQSFSALIRSLEQRESFSASDTIIRRAVQLAAPDKTGADPLAPLFRDVVVRRLHIGNETDNDSSTLLLRNRSKWEAVFLLQFDAGFQRSVYVRAGESFQVRYPRSSVAIHAIAGRDWADSVSNSFLRYHTSHYPVRQAFLGGFRARLQTTAPQETTGTPMFERGPASGAAKDTVSVAEDPGGKLSVSLNLGAD